MSLSSVKNTKAGLDFFWFCKSESKYSSLVKSTLLFLYKAAERYSCALLRCAKLSGMLR